MLKKAVVLTALISALGTGHSVMAQPPGGGGPGGGFTPPTFADYDKDKNGKITKEELAAYIAGRAAAPGGGGGGGRPPQDPETMLGRWDTNKDGSVSQAEFDARPRGGPGGGAGGPPGGGAGGPPRQ